MHVCGSHEQAIAKCGLRANFPQGPERHHGAGLPRLHHRHARGRRGRGARPAGRRRRDLRRHGQGARHGPVAGRRAGRGRRGRRGLQRSTGRRAGPRRPRRRSSSSRRDSRRPPSPRRPSCRARCLRTSRCSPPTSTSLRSWRSSPRCRTRAWKDSSPPGTPPPSPAGGSSKPSSTRHRIPVVVAGFEPLDILAGLARLVELIRDRTPRVVNMFPRCVTREGNLRAQEQLWSVFRPVGGRWRGIAHVPNGNLRLRDEWAHVDARRRFLDRPDRRSGTTRRRRSRRAASAATSCRASRRPTDCALFGRECVPDTPVGACMVSSEGTCKIWHQYGGIPNLGGSACEDRDDSRRAGHPQAGGRRPRDARPDRRRVPEGNAGAARSRDRARGDGRRRGALARRPMARRHDRLPRRPSRLFSRRRHRPALGLGHRQRSRHDGRDGGPGPDLRRGHRGGLFRAPTSSASRARSATPAARRAPRSSRATRR